MIVGAGLAGLIAAHAFPRMPLVEASPEPTETHRALLRFRGTAVSDLTGIEFRPVTVRKGIWYDGAFHAPNVRLCNMYSEKVLGLIEDRSIWNLEAATRYIAPENFYEQLLSAVGKRITWGFDFDFKDSGGESVVSTAPMNLVLESLEEEAAVDFRRASIWAERFSIAETDVHQTVYFPSESTALYRASLTGGLLICEFSAKPMNSERHFVRNALRTAFGIPLDREIKPIDSVNQRYGKIATIDEPIRQSLVVRLTQQHNIFSLGRFATWRNILLDDVVHDAAVIKRLLTASDYERRMTSIKLSGAQTS